MNLSAEKLLSIFVLIYSSILLSSIFSEDRKLAVSLAFVVLVMTLSPTYEILQSALSPYLTADSKGIYILPSIITLAAVCSIFSVPMVTKYSPAEAVITLFFPSASTEALNSFLVSSHTISEPS